MSGDEFIALIPAAILVMATWISWLHTATKLECYHRRKDSYLIVAAASISAVCLLLAILQVWSNWDVRDSWLYTSFYLFIGAAVTGLAMLLVDRTGLSLRDDVLERQNPAAAIAVGGAVVGHTLAFAGANIGDGPGWWVVIFCAGLANGSLLISWVALDRFAHVADAITIDRNRAAAWRTAGWFVSGGIVFGRGAAGNWNGPDNAILDFIKVSVGGLVLFGLVLVVESLLRPSSERQHTPFFGLLPGTLYICGAIIYVMTRPPW